MKTNKPVSNLGNQSSDTQAVNTPLATEISTAQQSAVNKRKSNWLIIGLVVLLLGTTSVFAYKYYGVKKQIHHKQPIPSPQLVMNSSPSSIFSPSPMVNPIADWKTYISTEYKFSLKYPPDLQEFTFKDVPIVDFFKQKDKEVLVFRVQTMLDHQNGFARIYQLSPNSKLPEDIVSGAITSKESSKTSGNIMLVYFSMVPNNPKTAGFGYALVVRLKEKNKLKEDSKLVEITAFGETKDEVDRYRNTFEQIVSSFEFID